MPQYFNVSKTTALPFPLIPNMVYVVAPTAGPSDYMELYAANADGSSARRLPTRTDILTWIDAAVVSAGGGNIVFADDIAARDAIPDPVNGLHVLVVDASGDETVNAGAATYAWDDSIPGWRKISEAESMDLVMTWGSITDGPTSTPAQVDLAVTRSHVHANATQLDAIGEDEDQNMTYRGEPVGAVWGTVDW